VIQRSRTSIRSGGHAWSHGIVHARSAAKSDPIDAEMAVRLLHAGKAKAVPKQTDGIVEPIRLLRVARHSAVKSRSAALVQVRDVDRLVCGRPRALATTERHRHAHANVWRPARARAAPRQGRSRRPASSDRPVELPMQRAFQRPHDRRAQPISSTRERRSSRPIPRLAGQRLTPTPDCVRRSRQPTHITNHTGDRHHTVPTFTRMF
jgi:hypothetical protein